MERSGMDRTDLGQDSDQWRALVKTVMEPSGSIKFWEIFEWLSDWRLLKKGSSSM
jgi:hypothetical protein